MSTLQQAGLLGEETCSVEAKDMDSSIESSPTENQVVRDFRKLTLDGFRSLGVMAIFLAGLQGQLLSITIQDNGSTGKQIVNACWVAGLITDVFGAVLATLTARWFEILSQAEINHLNETWKNKGRSTDNGVKLTPRAILVTYALFSGFGVVQAGVMLLILGLLVFVWTSQPLLVAIVAVVACALIAPLVGALFLPHQKGELKRRIIEHLGRKRGAW